MQSCNLSIFLRLVSSTQSNDTTGSDITDPITISSGIDELEAYDSNASRAVNGLTTEEDQHGIPFIDEENVDCDDNSSVSTIKETDLLLDQEENLPEPIGSTNSSSVSLGIDDNSSHCSQEIGFVMKSNVHSDDQEQIGSSIAPMLDPSKNPESLSHDEKSSYRKDDRYISDECSDFQNVRIGQEKASENLRVETEFSKSITQTVINYDVEPKTSCRTQIGQENRCVQFKESDKIILQKRKPSLSDLSEENIRKDKQISFNPVQNQILTSDTAIIYGISMFNFCEDIPHTIKKIVDENGNRIFYLYVTYHIVGDRIIAKKKLVNYSEIPSHKTANQIHMEFYNSSLKMRILIFSLFDKPETHDKSMKDDAKFKWRAFVRANYKEPVQTVEKILDKKTSKKKKSFGDFRRSLSFRNTTKNPVKKAKGNHNPGQSLTMKRGESGDKTQSEAAKQVNLSEDKSWLHRQQAVTSLTKKENESTNEKNTKVDSLTSHEPSHDALIRTTAQSTPGDHKIIESFDRSSVDPDDEKFENRKTEDSKVVAPAKPPRSKFVSVNPPEEEKEFMILHFKNRPSSSSINKKELTAPNRSDEKKKPESSDPLCPSDTSAILDPQNKSIGPKNLGFSSMGSSKRRNSFSGEILTKEDMEIQHNSSKNERNSNAQTIKKSGLRRTLSQLSLRMGMERNKSEKKEKDNIASKVKNEYDKRSDIGEKSVDEVKITNQNRTKQGDDDKKFKFKVKRRFSFLSHYKNTTDENTHNDATNSSHDEDKRGDATAKSHNEQKESGIPPKTIINPLFVQSTVPHQGSNSSDLYPQNIVRDIELTIPGSCLAANKQPIQMVLKLNFTSESSSSDIIDRPSEDLADSTRASKSQKNQSIDDLETVEVRGVDNDDNETETTNTTNHPQPEVSKD